MVNIYFKNQFINNISIYYIPNKTVSNLYEYTVIVR